MKKNVASIEELTSPQMTVELGALGYRLSNPESRLVRGFTPVGEFSIFSEAEISGFPSEGNRVLLWRVIEPNQHRTQSNYLQK